MSLSNQNPEPKLEAFEKRGYFVHIPFEGEDTPTVLYVAHKDFESLQGLIENPDSDWEAFRDEIFSLLEHSGHEGEHTLTESTTRELMDLVESEELPDESQIDDPLEEMDSEESSQ